MFLLLNQVNRWCNVETRYTPLATVLLWQTCDLAGCTKRNQHHRTWDQAETTNMAGHPVVILLNLIPAMVDGHFSLPVFLWSWKARNRFDHSMQSLLIEV